MSYYFIELLFRLNTKYRLSLGESHAKKKNPDIDIIPQQALATIFYSSPLVYIPDKYISKCAYSQEDLRVFIKISHYWFPIIQTTLRYYFEKNGAFNYAKIEEYLLPLCGEIDFPKSIDKLKDREERDYNKFWGDFVPPSGYNDWKSYYPYTINELKEEILSGSWKDDDRKILNLLCNSL